MTLEGALLDMDNPKNNLDNPPFQHKHAKKFNINKYLQNLNSIIRYYHNLGWPLHKPKIPINIVEIRHFKS